MGKPFHLLTLQLYKSRGTSAPRRAHFASACIDGAAAMRSLGNLGGVATRANAQSTQNEAAAPDAALESPEWTTA